jgi:hypothetical protein
MTKTERLFEKRRRREMEMGFMRVPRKQFTAQSFFKMPVPLSRELALQPARHGDSLVTFVVSIWNWFLSFFKGAK